MVSLEECKAHAPEGVELLRSLVEINSYTRNRAGVLQVQDLLYHELLSLDLFVERVPVSGFGDVLVASTPAYLSQKRGYILSGHVDTVFPQESGFQDFEVEGDTAIGPGVCDMKGGLVVILMVLRLLHSKSLLEKIPIRVLMTPDEEIGSPNSKSLLEQFSKGARGALVFEHAREGGAFVTRRKGVSLYTLEVTGVSAHSGNGFFEGRSAITELAHTVVALSQLASETSGVTLNPGIIAGGTSANTVADTARLDFDLRFPSTEDEARVCQALKHIVALQHVPGTEKRLEQKSWFPPLSESPASRSLAQAVSKRACELGLKRESSPIIYGGGSEASLFSSWGIPTLDGLGPKGGNPHRHDEVVVLSSIAEQVAVTASFLEREGTRN